MSALEITDVIVDFDPDTLARKPVTKRDALAKLEAAGASRFALREVEELPESGGALEAAAVDRVILQAHAEMQRLWETMAHGARVAGVAGAMIAAAREKDPARKIRIVDVGCGCGYVIRWLVAHRSFGDGVELFGADYNAVLIARANRLAAVERLGCEFVVANAFRMQEAATIYLSTGVLHHFQGSGLEEFFRAQALRGPLGFAHFDIRRSWATPLGAWLFHKAKMRIRVGQYDGYMSAVRAHDTGTLLVAARAGAKGFSVAEQNKGVPYLPMLRAMHAVIGLEPSLVEPFGRALGPDAAAVGPFA